MAMHGYVGLCTSVYGYVYVRLCMAMYGNVLVCTAVYGYV